MTTTNETLALALNSITPIDTSTDEELSVSWRTCDAYDLQTDVWRGRILRTVRERAQDTKDFICWLKEKEVTKTQAYSLIRLANSADTLIADGKLQPEAINNFSKRAFIEVSKADPEIQLLVSDNANSGDRITRREVKIAQDQFTAATSEFLPEEVRERVAEGSLPSKDVAPLANAMGMLPEFHSQPIKKTVAETPDVETIKDATQDAKALARFIENAGELANFLESIDVDNALDEASRLGCVSVGADLLKSCNNLKKSLAKAYMTWKKAQNLADRAYVDSGASTPNFRGMLVALEQLTSETINIPLTEEGDTVRFKIIVDNP